MNPILVTGATGTNGAELIRELLARGARVRALVRDAARAAARLPSAVELVVGDFGKPSTAAAALAGVERLFLLAAGDERMEDHEIGFIAAARSAGVRHIVQFSAIGAHPGSRSFFSRVHGRAEVALVDSGMDYTILQPSFFMQNLLASAPTIRTDGVLYSATGPGAAGHVDVRDIAAVAATALTESVEKHAGEIYLLTGPESLTHADLAERLSQVAGRTVRYVQLADDAYLAAMRQAGLPRWLAQAVLDLDVRCRTGDFSNITDVVKRIGGREPISIDQFLAKHAQAFRAA